MPLPKPNENEEHDAFVERCMKSVQMHAEFPKRDQRVAVCEQMWEDHHKEPPKPE